MPYDGGTLVMMLESLHGKNDVGDVPWSKHHPPAAALFLRQQRSRRLQDARRRPRGPGPTRAFPCVSVGSTDVLYDFLHKMLWMCFSHIRIGNA